MFSIVTIIIIILITRFLCMVQVGSQKYRRMIKDLFFKCGYGIYQIWLNLPKANQHFFYSFLPMHNSHFGCKQNKKFLREKKKKNTGIPSKNRSNNFLVVGIASCSLYRFYILVLLLLWQKHLMSRL